METAPSSPTSRYVDPYSRYASWRQDEPVRWDHEWGGWVLTRYGDVLAVMDDDSLSSDRNRMLRVTLPEAPHESLATLSRAMSLIMSWSDEPRHGRLRRVVRGALNPRVFRMMRPRIEQVVAELLRSVKPSRPFDVIRDLAYPLPLTVISDLLGIAPEDRAWIKRQANDWILPLSSGATSQDFARAEQAFIELATYFGPIVADRRRHPQGDLMGALIAGVAEGHVINDEELIANCVALFIGGHETTTSLIGNGLLALLRHPEQLELLREDATRIDLAVEECLRYESPLQRVVRLADQRTTIDSRQVEPGQLIIAMIGGANRDPSVFTDADRFDITRAPNRHLAFGHGSKFCLGAPLARLEATIAIRAVIQRFPRLRLSQRLPVWQPNASFRGLSELWLQT